MPQHTLIIVDGHNYYFRSYFGAKMHGQTSPSPERVIEFFWNSLRRIIKNTAPTHCAVVFDAPDSLTKKREEIADYKANRPQVEEDMFAAFAPLKERLAKANVGVFEVSGEEADDIIAGIAHACIQQKSAQPIIISSDHDFFQVLDSGIRLYREIKGEGGFFSKKDFVAKFAFEPSLYADYLALKGDKTDNIGGVAGIGEKGARELVSRFGSLESIYENIDFVPWKYARRLQEGREGAFSLRTFVALTAKSAPEFRLEDMDFDVVSLY